MWRTRIFDAAFHREATVGKMKNTPSLWLADFNFTLVALSSFSGPVQGYHAQVIWKLLGFGWCHVTLKEAAGLEIHFHILFPQEIFQTCNILLLVVHLDISHHMAYIITCHQLCSHQFFCNEWESSPRHQPLVRHLGSKISGRITSARHMKVNSEPNLRSMWKEARSISALSRGLDQKA